MYQDNLDINLKMTSKEDNGKRVVKVKKKTYLRHLCLSVLDTYSLFHYMFWP